MLLVIYGYNYVYCCLFNKVAGYTFNQESVDINAFMLIVNVNKARF